MNIGKPDFSDLNKFIVSMGLVLIGLSFFIPWLFLNDGIKSLISTENFNNLTELSKSLAIKNQEYSLKFIKWIPRILWPFLILGIGISIYGLIRWFRKQSKIDEKEDLELRKLRLDLDTKVLSVEEIKQKAINEIKQDANLELVLNKPKLINNEKIEYTADESDSWNELIKIEDIVYNKIIDYNSFNYEVKRNVSIKNKYKADIIMQSIIPNNFDKLIEVKYLQERLNNLIIINSLNYMKDFIKFYESEYKRNTQNFLLFIYKDGIAKEDEIKRFTNTITNYHKGIDIDNLFVFTMSVEELVSNPLYHIVT
jgi:hypothetical protein